MLFRVIFFGWMVALAVVVAIVAAMLFVTPANAACSRAWDPDFRAAMRTFMPFGLKSEWRWLRAQTQVESACRPDVCSQVGACGLLQIMPDTWRDLTHREPGTSIFQPKLNIIYGAKYQAWQARQWRARKRGPVDMYELGLAGYNAGLGNILDAQAECGGGRLWDEVKPCLGKVTGKHATETINYVDRWRALVR